MKVLLISYGIKEFDGRLKEIYDVAQKLGEVTYVSCGISKSHEKNENIILKKNHKYMGLILYLKFLYTSLITAKNLKNIDVVISDNFFSSIPVLIIKKIFEPKYIIQDVRELYLPKEAKAMSGKIFSKFELILMKKSDVVLCANNDRSEIMYKKFKLKKRPIVFENIRTLNESFDIIALDQKYKKDFKFKYNIVCTGGISIARTTNKLVEAMSKLPMDYGLYIIGGGQDSDKKVINNIIRKFSLKNVKLIDKISLSELRYIVQQADIGIVNYHQQDLNNIYCASGKVYEYLGEGIPIVTTENPPLKKVCDTFQVGEADNNFYNGILRVTENLKYYKENVNIYMNGISVQKYNENIALKINNVFTGITNNE